MYADKDRLDKVMVYHALVPSRSKAHALIKQSCVTVNGAIVCKPNTVVYFCDTIAIISDPCPWVSRGGAKLDFALAHFGCDVRGTTALDIGASTGGFTQVLLHYGADIVYAVDVGTHQLHDTVRMDSRVVVLEQTDARNLTPAMVPCVDMMVADVSFISLQKALPVPLSRVKSKGWGLFLIKPQFEVGRSHIGKAGVVGDTRAIDISIAHIRDFFVRQGWRVQGVVPCHIRGGNGNQEYMVYAHKI